MTVGYYSDTVDEILGATLKATVAVARATYHDMFRSNNEDSEFAKLVNDAGQAVDNILGAAYKGFSNLRDPDARKKMLGQTSMLDLVNAVLTAKSVYMLGSSLYYIGTNTEAFTNEATTTLMQSPREYAAEFKEAAISLSNLPGWAGAKIQQFQTSMEQTAVARVKLGFDLLPKVTERNSTVASSPAVEQIATPEPTRMPAVQPPQVVAAATTPASQTTPRERVQMGKGKSSDSKIGIVI